MGLPPIEGEYEVTDRGRFYCTYMVFWPEYVNRYGASSHSYGIRNEIVAGRATSLILELLANIYCTLNESHNNRVVDFRINRNSLLEQINERQAQVFRQPRRGPAEGAGLSLDDLSTLLMGRLDVVEEHGFESNRYYLVLGQRLVEACRTRHAPLELRHIYSGATFKS